MEQLMSGLYGALIATILTIIYLHFSEKSKLRTEVSLEVIGFCDEIYHRFQNIHVLKDQKFKNNNIDKDEYRVHSNELTILLKSTITQAKVAMVFGEGVIFDEFMEFCTLFREAASILRKSSVENWEVENKKFMSLIEEKIEPLRKSILANLLQSIKVKSIAYDLINSFIATIKK